MRSVLLTGVAAILAGWSMLGVEPVRSYVVNGGFEAGPAGWSLPPREFRPARKYSSR